MDARDLLELYVELHNEAIDSGIDGTRELLAEGVGIEIEGQALSAIRQHAMIEAFRGNELMLWKIGITGDDVAFAEYAWRRSPRIGGTIHVRAAEDHIEQLTLKPGYSRTFATLSMRPPANAVLEEGGPDAFSGD
ncbi:MAG: hypothetical protein JRI68_23135 [Deltaproteobacteria bacterium]|nr:hypothetical protein [Deltaproteobacteria bacterium]